jgi:hypothetical protein
MAYALIDLYTRPEYIAPLREEVEGSQFDHFRVSSQGLPRVDSFIKESARLNLFDSSKHSGISGIYKKLTCSSSSHPSSSTPGLSFLRWFHRSQGQLGLRTLPSNDDRR